MYSDVKLHINGEWCDGTGGRSEPIINPATGKPLARLAHAALADLDQALHAADKGFKTWRKVSAFDRYKLAHAHLVGALRRFATALGGHSQQRLNQAGADAQAAAGEIARARDALDAVLTKK